MAEKSMCPACGEQQYCSRRPGEARYYAGEGAVCTGCWGMDMLRRERFAPCAEAGPFPGRCEPCNLLKGHDGAHMVISAEWPALDAVNA